MIFKQFYFGFFMRSSYLIGIPELNSAIVIDPQREIDIYFEEAAKNQLHIKHVFLTHYYGNFLEEQAKQWNQAGAAVYLGLELDEVSEFTSVKEGISLNFAQIRLEILETPGHSPEAISILLYDLEQDSETPYALFSGDIFFIGNMGRPDLLTSIGVTSPEVGCSLYYSIYKKLLTLPEKTLVCSAHGANFMEDCEDPEEFTLRNLKKRSDILQQLNCADFLNLVMSNGFIA